MSLKTQYEEMLEQVETAYGTVEKVLIIKDPDTAKELPYAAVVNGGNGIVSTEGELWPAQESIDPELEKVLYKTQGQYECYRNTSWSENEGETVARTVIIDYKNQMINTCSMTSQGIGIGMFGTIVLEENDTKFAVKIDGEDYTINTMEEAEDGKEILKLIDSSGAICMCLEKEGNNKKILAPEELLNSMENGENVKILSLDSNYDISQIGLVVE